MLSLNLNNVRVFCHEPEWFVGTAFNIGYRIMLAHVFRQRMQVIFICERRRLDDILVIHSSVLLQAESLGLVPTRARIAFLLYLVLFRRIHLKLLPSSFIQSPFEQMPQATLEAPKSNTNIKNLIMRTR